MACLQTTAAVENQEILNNVSMCILALVIWHANHIFSAMWHVWLHHIFLHYLKQYNFQKEIYCT